MSSRRFRALLLVSLPLVLILALAACGKASAVSEHVVKITLSDYKIVASQTTFTTGVKYRFVVTNTGRTAHEIMLMPPVSDMMGMGSNMEELDKMALMHITAEELPPGATQSLDDTFTQPAAKGKLELACHVDGHYLMGMRLPITAIKG